MNKNTVCPLVRIARGNDYPCNTDCALCYNDECLIKICLLNLTGITKKETDEKIQKLQKDLLFTATFGGLPMDYYTKGSGSFGD